MDNLEDLFKCYLCNKHLLQDKLLNDKVVKSFHPERLQVEFYTNIGSRMPVSLCCTCKDNFDLDDKEIHKKILKNVIDGWIREQDFLVNNGSITREQADNCIKEHRNISILFKCEGMNDYQIKARALK